LSYTKIGMAAKGSRYEMSMTKVNAPSVDGPSASAASLAATR
jgi:hypothetical protein|tara:strand:+ start:241 stop:366 length:126 start_codon:yes stop_codon:yes gene_type:complete